MSGCEKYQEMISRLLDGELEAAEEAALAEHLKACPDCAALYAAFSGLSEVLAQDLEEPPERIRENVMAEIRRGEIEKKNRRRLSRPVRGLLATAACLVLVIGAAYASAPALKKSADTAQRAGAAIAGYEREAVVTQEAWTETAPEEGAPAPVPESQADFAAAPQPAAAPAPQESVSQKAPEPAGSNAAAEDGAAQGADVLRIAPEEGQSAGETVLPASYVELWSENRQAELSALLKGQIKETAREDAPMMAMALPGLGGPVMDVPAEEPAALEEPEEEEAAEETADAEEEKVPEELTPELLADRLLYVLSLDEEGQRQINIYLYEDRIYYMDTADGVLHPARCTAKELEELLV